MKKNYVVSYLTLEVDSTAVKTVLITYVDNESIARNMAIGLYADVTETSICYIEELV